MTQDTKAPPAMVHVRLEPEVHRALVKMAEGASRSLAGEIRHALREWVTNATSKGNA